MRSFSSPTVLVSVAKDDSRSSRSVLASRLCSAARSAWILVRFSAMLGFPFRLRASSLLDSRSARATLRMASWFSWNLALFDCALSALRWPTSSSYCASSTRCSWMIRVISSPTICESSSRCAITSGVIDARKLSFSSASSMIDETRAASIVISCDEAIASGCDIDAAMEKKRPKGAIVSHRMVLTGEIGRRRSG